MDSNEAEIAELRARLDALTAPKNKKKKTGTVAVIFLLAGVALAIILVIALNSKSTSDDGRLAPSSASVESGSPSSSGGFASTDVSGTDDQSGIIAAKYAAIRPGMTYKHDDQSGITAAKYAAIRPGMTYKQVVAILGSPGEEISSSDLAGYRTVMVDWKNNSGANMNAMFQNGRLINKAQMGLQ